MGSKLPRLATSRYNTPDAYIGQIFRASGGIAQNNVRYPCFVGKGDRLFQMRNQPIRRSFVYGEPLIFDSLTFSATLDYYADGRQDGAIRLVTGKGVEINAGRWKFIADGNGNFSTVQISPEVFDITESYFMDYQSVDRTVIDPLPFNDLRTIKSVGLGQDVNQYEEYQDYFIPNSYGNQYIAWGDPSVPTVANSTAAVAVDPNTYLGVEVANTLYIGKYNRKYAFEVTQAGSGATPWIIAWRAIDNQYGRLSQPATPVNPAVVSTWPTVQIPGTATGVATVQVEGILTLAVNVTGPNAILLSDIFEVVAKAVPLIEVDDRISNVSTFNSASPVRSGLLEDFAEGEVGQAVSDEILSVDSSTYVDAYNKKYVLRCTAKNSTQVTFYYTRQGIDAPTLAPQTILGNFGAAPISLGIGFGANLVFSANFKENFTADSVLKVLTIAGTKWRTGMPIQVATSGGALPIGLSASTRYYVVTTSNPLRIKLSSTYANAMAGVTDVTDAMSSNGTPPNVIFQDEINVGDTFVFELFGPKIFCHAKDDRSYKFSVVSASLGQITMTYLTNTPEGGFGQVNNGAAVTDASNDGQFILPGNVVFHARNMRTAATATPATPGENRFTALDVVRIGNFGNDPGIKNTDTIDWSLTKKASGEKQDVLLDIQGSVTGEAGTYYIILNNVPSSEISIKITEVASGYSLVALGSAYVKFDTQPVNPSTLVPYTELTVSYEYAGNEPLPGQLYYITGNVLRPDSMYNKPIQILTESAGEALLAPSTINNDLFIMNGIAWETNPPGIFIVQVKDTDGDGVYTKTDYEAAIEATKQKKEITDKIVLNRVIDTLPRLLAINVEDNDPFNKRFEYVWVGPEDNMVLGDTNTPGTIIYTAKNTLQVYGQSPAHGTRIMHGSPGATKSIVLDSGTQATVNLDGSFIAGYLAAKNSSFADPSTTLLKQTVTGFDTITVWEEPENLLLGANSIIYFKEIGTGIYRIEEDLTVDTFNQNTNLINCMNQYQDVIKVVAAEMAANLISMVPPDVETGVGLVKAQLVASLRGLLSRGRIANYQDDNGNTREFDINSDIYVEIDDQDKTLYHFYFAFYTRKPIKRLYGLCSIDTNRFQLV